MQKDVVTLYMKYNKMANDGMDNIIKTLSKAEWEKPLGGYFPSVRSLCSHIYVCDFNYLRRFKNVRSFKTLDNPFFDKEYSFQETLFEDMGEYLAKRPDMDSKMSAFADEVTDADMGSILKYNDSHGNPIERNFGGIIVHFLNHGTHHRGMVSVYLEMLGKENDFNSLARAL